MSLTISPLVIIGLFVLSCVMMAVQTIFCPPKFNRHDKTEESMGRRACQGLTGLGCLIPCLMSTVLIITKVFSSSS